MRDPVTLAASFPKNDSGRAKEKRSQIPSDRSGQLLPSESQRVLRSRSRESSSSLADRFFLKEAVG